MDAQGYLNGYGSIWIRSGRDRLRESLGSAFLRLSGAQQQWISCGFVGFLLLRLVNDQQRMVVDHD